jgi:hypothetical protein
MECFWVAGNWRQFQEMAGVFNNIYQALLEGPQQVSGLGEDLRISTFKINVSKYFAEPQVLNLAFVNT